MSAFEFEFIPKENILEIMPLMMKINSITPEEKLRERILEMSTQNYKCLGIYSDDKLIGICGLWFLTRHYCGKTMEPDHVIIDEKYQGQGVGQQLFDWLFEFAKMEGIEAAELNTYVQNTRSHKFYYNLGFEIKGYHFLKILNRD
ncbi:MAG: GNAT family N-acetyltransferase [Crocinitomicaceae bacterium]|nr:GNAT family N-acetyltransferase [Crocinitomicaceae bacterium]